MYPNYTHHVLKFLIVYQRSENSLQNCDDSFMDAKIRIVIRLCVFAVRVCVTGVYSLYKLLFLHTL